MSISRRNWSALSSLARQWTMEDEEEVEREKRRRVKTSSTADPDEDFSPTPTPKNTPSSDSAFETESSSEMPQHSNSMEQVQLDFVEMLRVRDERRRMRHVETLRRQKEEGEDEAEVSSGGGARIELLGDMAEEEGSVVKPQPPVKPTSHSPSSATTNNARSKKHESEESSGKDPDPKPSSNPARKFVSSVSISLDKSPSVSGRTTPMSPGSPTGPFSPREHWPSPCQSPSPLGARSPFQNGHTQETSVNGSTDGNFEQATKPAFIRQSSRTTSFRMMRKKEEEASPLQRSFSVKMTSKKFESNAKNTTAERIIDQNEDENKTPSFQRNSRQRISSRSIQEKMERLAQAAQKSELTRFPDVTQRTLVLLEEVSRKRGIFEKEQQQQQQQQHVQSPTSPGVSRQEFRGFTSGMSDRINRWLNKTSKTGSSHSPTDLRHVDITSKRSLFENRGEDRVSKASPGKI